MLFNTTAVEWGNVKKERFESQSFSLVKGIADTSFILLS